MNTRSFLRAKRFSTADILFLLFRTVFALESQFSAEIFELKMSLRAENSAQWKTAFMITSQTRNHLATEPSMKNSRSTLKEDQSLRLLVNFLFYRFNRSEPTYKSQRIKLLYVIATRNQLNVDALNQILLTIFSWGRGDLTDCKVCTISFERLEASP